MRPYADFNSPFVTPQDGKITPVWLPILRALVAVITPDPTATLIYATKAGKTGFYTMLDLLAPGAVVQAVVGTTNTPATNSTDTYATTGLSATIAPRLETSAILAVAFQNGVRKVNNTGVQLQLLRDATVVAQIAVEAGRTGTATLNDVGTLAGVVFDTPTTTSAVVYSTAFCSSDNIASVEVQNNDATSMLVLLEVTT